jgi:hypothetical protein
MIVDDDDQATVFTTSSRTPVLWTNSASPSNMIVEGDATVMALRASVVATAAPASLVVFDGAAAIGRDPFERGHEVRASLTTDATVSGPHSFAVQERRHYGVTFVAPPGMVVDSGPSVVLARSTAPAAPSTWVSNEVCGPTTSCAASLSSVACAAFVADEVPIVLLPRARAAGQTADSPVEVASRGPRGSRKRRVHFEGTGDEETVDTGAMVPARATRPAGSVVSFSVGGLAQRVGASWSSPPASLFDASVWQLPEAVFNDASRRRVTTGATRPEHQERLLKGKRVEDLADVLPVGWVYLMLGGTSAALCGSRDDAIDCVQGSLVSMGGTDGSGLLALRSALRTLATLAREMGLACCLPAIPFFVAQCVFTHGRRAFVSGKGSQQGRQAAESLVTSLRRLAAPVNGPRRQRGLGLPIQADNILVDGALARVKALFDGRGPVRDRGGTPVGAGPLPVAARCLIEYCAVSVEHVLELAPELTASAAWCIVLFCRSYLLYGLGPSLRMVEAWRSYAVGTAAEHVASSFAYIAKDGDPMQVWVPHEGFLGAYAWGPSHNERMRGLEFVFPRFTYQRGHAGDIRRATGVVWEFEPQRSRLADHTRNVLSLRPLSYTREECRALGLTGHLAHQTACDQMTYIGPSRGPQFDSADVQVAGNWRRVKQTDPSAVGEVRSREEAARAQTTAIPDARGLMEVRYAIGEHRHGACERSIDVRRRHMRAGQQGLRLEPRHWSQLERGAADFAIFRRLPPWNGSVPPCVGYNRPMPLSPAPFADRPAWEERIVILHDGRASCLAPRVDETFSLHPGTTLANMFPLLQRSGESISAAVAVEAFARVFTGGETPESVAIDLAIDCDDAQAALYVCDDALEMMSQMADKLVSRESVIGLDVDMDPATSHAVLVADRVWELVGILS